MTNTTPANGPQAKYTFLMTSYMLGAVDGRNVGKAGYSYEFVAQLFRPILEKWGRVIKIRDPEKDLQREVKRCRDRAETPIHFSLLPFQDTPLVEGVVNIAYPFWEFRDVPDHPFDGNPRNDWVRTCDKTDLCIVSGPFTQQAFHRGGTTTPVVVVPSPVPDGYFAVPLWDPEQSVEIDTWAFDFPPREKSELLNRGTSDAHPSPVYDPDLDRSLTYRVLQRIAPAFRSLPIYSFVANLIGGFLEYRRTRPIASPRYLPFPQVEKLVLRGVVYTSILNPFDGRKNWEDLLNGFLYTVGKYEDVTLVLKLVTSDVQEVKRIIMHYVNRDVPHKCRVVFISEFLTEAQLVELCRASTYYVHTTKAEGSCLPLTNFLGGARPAVSPIHSSLQDYFSAEHGFVIDSEQEPAPWPHESRHRLRTTWARLSWNSICSATEASYHATRDVAAYHAMANRCRSDMKAWAGYEAVEEKLRHALSHVMDLT